MNKPSPSAEQDNPDGTRAKRPVEVTDEDAAEEYAPIARRETVETAPPEICGCNERVLENTEDEKDKGVTATSRTKDDALPPRRVRIVRQAR